MHNATYPSKSHTTRRLGHISRSCSSISSITTSYLRQHKSAATRSNTATHLNHHKERRERTGLGQSQTHKDRRQTTSLHAAPALPSAWVYALAARTGPCYRQTHARIQGDREWGAWDAFHTLSPCGLPGAVPPTSCRTCSRTQWAFSDSRLSEGGRGATTCHAAAIVSAITNGTSNTNWTGPWGKE